MMVAKTRRGTLVVEATWQAHRAAPEGHCSCCLGPAPEGVVVAAVPARGKLDLAKHPHHFYCASCARMIGQAVKS
jgi:hypothetical protein